MRVPVYVTVPACIAVALLVWFIGARDKDFVTPPTPERLAEIAAEWKKDQPNIPPPKPIDAALLAEPEQAAPKTPAESAAPRENTIPTGDLMVAPALSEYGSYGGEGAEAMIRLATLLETKAEYQRALLAWERVIDTTAPNESQRQQAVRAVQRLRNALPPWNPDPSEDIALTLHAGATLKDKEVLTSALEAVAALVTEASGNVVRVDTKASFGKNRGVKTPRIPVAIWFSRPAREPGGTAAETPPISFMADPKQPDALAKQVAAGVYALLRTHLASETSFSPLPEYPAGEQPEHVLKHHVTRLMWREFVKSMKE